MESNLTILIIKHIKNQNIGLINEYQTIDLNKSQNNK